MKNLIAASLFFIVGLVFAAIATAKYTKAKKTEGDALQMKPHYIRFGIVIALFVISQILIIMSKN